MHRLETWKRHQPLPAGNLTREVGRKNTRNYKEGGCRHNGPIAFDVILCICEIMSLDGLSHNNSVTQINTKQMKKAGGPEVILQYWGWPSWEPWGEHSWEQEEVHNHRTWRTKVLPWWVAFQMSAKPWSNPNPNHRALSHYVFSNIL